MRAALRVFLLSCLPGVVLSGAASSALGQGADSNLVEEDAARRVVRLWQQSNNETIRKQAAGTLQQMGAETSPTLAKLLAHEIEEARVNAATRDQHLATAKFLCTVLGRLGSLLVREEKVRTELLAIARKSDVPVEVRQAAIEALGRIYAGRSVFLILNREEFWVKFQVDQRTPREMAQFLQNEAATLKVKFNPGTLNADTARELVLTTRNVGRKIRLYRNVIALLNELEPPRDKTLSEHILQDLADIESNLQIVAAGGPSAKDAAGRAETAATDLYEELEHTAYSILRWQALNRATSEVIASLRFALEDPAPLIRFSAVEALGRVYGKVD